MLTMRVTSWSAYAFLISLAKRVFPLSPLAHVIETRSGPDIQAVPRGIHPGTYTSDRSSSAMKRTSHHCASEVTLPCFSALFFILLVAFSTASEGQSPDVIPQNADLSQARVLANHHPQWANPARDAGPVPDGQALEGITLVLARSPEREKAFEAFLNEQNNPQSPNYHHWLTPDEIGERYGLSDSDLGVITAWLGSHGVHINFVAPTKAFIGIGGTAADVGRAFQTDFHYYEVGGERRYSVSSDPMIPTAIAPAIKTVRGLFTVREQPQHRRIATNSALPEFNSNTGHLITPADFATIYDVPSAYTGAGVTIGIVGHSRTDISDFENFKNLTGSTFSNPTEIIPTAFGGVDPGAPYTSCTILNLLCNGYDSKFAGQDEATLDVLRAGSVAPGAHILLVVSASTSSNGDGIGPAAMYLVHTSPVPAQIMSISFGDCEADAGLPGVNYWDSLFQVAAGEGISVLVSSGDSGSSGCDYPFRAPLANPKANSPNAICSSSYATCVGGTEFNDQSNPSLYWSPQNGSGFLSARSYIPEGAWNESNSASVAASGGGVSAYINTPAWQTGTGIPPVSAKRYTPDIAFAASGHDAYFGCFEADGKGCGDSNSVEPMYGTSAAAPSMAGIVALLDQKQGGPQGNLNPEIYALAASAPSVFHDVTVATSGVTSCDVNTPSMCNNSIAGPSGSSAQAGYVVGVGYDEVTGWGSLDVANFIQNYSQTLSAFLIPSTSTGAAPLTTTFTARATGTASGTVNYSIWWNCSDAGTSVSEVEATCGTLSNTCQNTSIGYKCDGVSASSEQVTYAYSAAGNYTAKLIVEEGSAPPAQATATITVTSATKGTPTVGVSPSPSSITSGGTSTVTVTVTSTSGGPTPTGTVALSLAGTLLGNGTLSGGSTQIPVPGSSLTVGNDTLTATYTPDTASSSSFTSATGTGTITVTSTGKSTPTVSVTPLSTSITTAQPVTVNVSVFTTSGPSPTGTVTVTIGSYTSPAMPLVNASAAVLIPAGSLPAGTYTPTSYYSGDSNFNAASGTANNTVTVTSAGKSTPTVSVTPLLTSITTAQPITVNVSVFTASGPSPTGTVTVTIGSYTSLAMPLVNASAAIVIPGGSLSPGNYILTSSYSGDSNYNAASGSANNSVTVTGAVSGIASLTASANTVTAGNSVTFSVTLSATSPTGTIVYLDSSASSVLPGGSIPIPAGSNTGTGSLTSSSSVTQPTNAVITASLGGVPFPQTQTITVNPITGTPTITAFNASSNTVTAGGSVSFIVQLSQNAPPGTTINLSSSATGVIPNGSFTIPAGLNGGYTILTSSSSVTQPSQAVITASLGGVQFPQTQTITVNPVTIAPGNFAWANYGTAPNTLCVGATSVVLSNFIYIFGVGPQCQGYKFDPSASAWTQLAAMPSPEDEGGAAILNGKIYLVNGAIGGGQLLIYDPVANQWTSGSTPPTLQRGPAVVMANGKLYDIGGYDSATGSVVQEYDPVTNSWTQKASMPTPRGFATAAVINGIIYVIGGRTGNITEAVEAYDPTQDTWTAGENMTEHARFLMGSVILNNKTYLIDGSIDGPGAVPTVQEYDPSLPIPYAGAENQWRDMVSTLTARRGPVAGIVNGTTYVIGGTDGNGIALASIEQGTYTPAATPTVTMTPGSTSITSAQSLSVQVTVSGPSGAPTPTGSVVLSGGGYTSQAQSLSGGVTNFVIPAGKLAVGADSLTATYTPDSNSSSSYVTATQSVSITVSAVAAGIGLTNGGPITVSAGGSGTSALTVTPSGGFTGQVIIACAVSGSPTGMTCLAPATSVTGASAATSTLTVSTTAATPAGTYTGTVTASDAATGKITSSTSVSITVNLAPSIALTSSGGITVAPGNSGTSILTVTPAGGFTGQVNFACSVSGSATGLTCLAPTVSVIGSSAATSTLTVGTTAATPTGNYTATITATDASTGQITAQTSVPIVVRAALNFSLSNSGPITVTGGNSGTTVLTVTPSGGFTGQVNFACSVSTSPAGLICSAPSLNVVGTQAVNSTLTVATSSSTPAGSYSATVTATDAATGQITAQTTVSITVNAAPSFSIGYSGPISVTQGASTGNASTIYISPSNGFTGTVSLSCTVTNVPANAISPVTCTIPSSVSVTSTSTQTAALAANSTLTTTAGTYTITVTAQSGATSQQTQVNVTVTPTPQGFALSVSPATVAVAQGNSATTTITVTDVGGFAGTVTLSASGLTSGLTASFAPGSAAGTQVLTITASSSATVTSSPETVTITGTSGTMSATTSIALTVVTAPSFGPGPGGTTSISATRGTPVTATVSVVGANGFAGTVTLGCKVTPANLNDMPGCTLSPASVSISGTTPQTSTLTITTTAASSAANRIRNLFWPGAGTATLAFVLFFAVPKRRHGAWLSLVGLIVLIVPIGIIGCGGKSTNSGSGGGVANSGTTPGTYTITVTGTSGTVSATVGTVTLTVN
jgi:subtilase family serine protease